MKEPRVLLDTNILIHREGKKVLKDNIGILFNWLTKLKYRPCIHPYSVEELKKHADKEQVSTIETKIKSYDVLKTIAPETETIKALRKKFDVNANDAIDTSILNEVYSKRVDLLITEDKKLLNKAFELGIESKVYSVDAFLERANIEFPDLTDYKVLSVKKEYFGNINLSDDFFESFKEDYSKFESWFNSKSDEESYICKGDNGDILAFLYLKIERESEDYSNINPIFEPKKRLKVGTFKVVLNGYRLGERFLKIIFDNACVNNVEEIYVTVFNHTPDQKRLIDILEDWGFIYYGVKTTADGEELVYLKKLLSSGIYLNIKEVFPRIDKSKNKFFKAIYPKYHTELFPDSILKTESPAGFIENLPHRNALQKVYISSAPDCILNAGDLIFFYRTKEKDKSAYYSSVMTTIGIVQNVVKGIKNEKQFIDLCKNRSVLTNKELKEYWNYRSTKPYIVNFIYAYSLQKKINLKRLIELGIIADVNNVPRGFEQLTDEQFEIILKESCANESYFIN